MRQFHAKLDTNSNIVLLVFTIGVVITVFISMLVCLKRRLRNAVETCFKKLCGGRIQINVEEIKLKPIVFLNVYKMIIKKNGHQPLLFIFIILQILDRQ